MNYTIGDTIRYGSRVVVVDEKESDIKNGRPGFGGIVVEGPETGMSVWGYDDQINEVLS